MLSVVLRSRFFVAAAFVAVVALTLMCSTLGKPIATWTATASVNNYLVRACGNGLADILQHVCRGQYNQYQTEDESNDVVDDDGSSSSSVSRDDKGGKKSEAITEKCCLQACSLHDLSQYCSNGTSSVSASVPNQVLLHRITAQVRTTTADAHKTKKTTTIRPQSSVFQTAIALNSTNDWNVRKKKDIYYSNKPYASQIPNLNSRPIRTSTTTASAPTPTAC